MAKLFNRQVGLPVAILIAGEMASITLALGAAAYLRLGNDAFALFRQPAGAGNVVLLAVVCLLCLYYADLYDGRILHDRREVFERLLRALGATSMILAIVYFWFPGLILGRGVFFMATLLVLALVAVWRLFFEWTIHRLRSRERFLLVGTNPAAVSLARELYERYPLAVEIVGFIDPDPARIGAPVLNPGVIGTIEDIPAIVRARAIDRVVVSLADARGKLPMGKLLEMRLGGVTFDHLASVYESYTGKIAVENLRPSWLIFSDGFRKSRLARTMKRVVDVVGGSAGLILSLPIMAVVAVAVKLTSSGPILYHQQRVGREGRVFTIYKFRSMTRDAEAATGAVWAQPDDNRVTTIGRFLRRTRLDEFPQFWNVFKGDMSLVGPRPERPEFVQHLSTDIPFYRQRHLVRPGLTGWAQVRYTYGATAEDALEKLQYDLFYIKNMTLAFDFFILFATAKTVLLRRGGA
jgi:sugar transferase (PEP-CTERM system associated)